MGKQTRTAISQSKRAFEERNVEMARDLVRQDDVVDNLNRECFSLALEIGDDPDRREWAMTMLLAARAIERIGDNAVDIGEQVAFIVTGLFREFEDASHPQETYPRLGHLSGIAGSGLATIRSETSATWMTVHALRGDRYRLEHHPRAGRRAGDGQLKKVMEQRAYTRINKAFDAEGAIMPEKVARGR